MYPYPTHTGIFKRKRRKISEREGWADRRAFMKMLPSELTSVWLQLMCDVMSLRMLQLMYSSIRQGRERTQMFSL